MTLRRRLAMLAGVYRAKMPYRDPHTAAPAFWALRQAPGCAFEASVVPLPGGDTRYHKGLEALALALHRQQYRRSPTVNFGRMPRGYRLSSGSNARLLAAGKRRRGGPTRAEQKSWTEGIPPVGPLGGDPQGARWCGHNWSDWLPLGDAIRHVQSDALGLYRIRDPRLTGLISVGQGYIRARLAAHFGKGNTEGHRQAPFFGPGLECGWTINAGWLRHQRAELETDLIGGHVLSTGHAPTAQFLG